jgi:hypothetical protein
MARKRLDDFLVQSVRSDPKLPALDRLNRPPGGSLGEWPTGEPQINSRIGVSASERYCGRPLRSGRVVAETSRPSWW